MVKRPWKSKSLKPTLDKTPKLIESPPSDANAQFIWRVNDRYIDYGYDKLGWCNCEPLVLLKDVVQELQSYEGLNWQQVRQKSSHNHRWKFHELPKELQERLVVLNLDYLPELYQLALTSTCRVWGFKEIATYFLIWYDPKHKGYKTPAR